MLKRNALILSALAIGMAGCSPGQDEATTDANTASNAQQPAAPISGVHLDAMDTATPATDDFYQYANGGWLNTTEIPEIYTGYTVYHEVYEDAEEALRVIIEDAAENSGTPGTEAQQIGDFYSSWLDEETINALGVEPVRDELDFIAAIESNADLPVAMATLSKAGIAIPYNQSVWPDLKDSKVYAFYLSQDGITLPDRDFYLDKDNENFRKAREGLPGYIAKMLVVAGYAEDAAAEKAQAVYAIEEKIAEAQWTNVENRDPQKGYNPYAVNDLTQLGEIDWKGSLEALDVGFLERVIVSQPSYFEAMSGLINDIPLDDWKAYLSFRVLDSWGYNLSQDIADIRFDFRNRLVNGQEVDRPRWKRGISMVNGNLGEAVGKLYVAKYFPPEAKAKMETLVGNVAKAFGQSIDELAWMSDATKAKAKEKLSKFNAKIGYPDEWRDYSELEIVRGDHMGNFRRSLAFEVNRQIQKLKEPVDNKEWLMTPQTVNAYYDPTKNEIVFPAARLQPPFFQLQADDAINYGAVGGVIGHEMSHGFDDSGSQFDGDGNLVNWWTEEDRAAFDERTKVLVAQYSSYEPIDGMHINGELTLGENIGDLSGVAMAYKAYLLSLNGQEPPVIDGLTGAQRFFIGYAMSRKGKYKDESTINRLASDPHSPLKYRVNGVYRNIDAFHDAFGTKEGDGMWLPPEERVRIW